PHGAVSAAESAEAQARQDTLLEVHIHAEPTPGQPRGRAEGQHRRQGFGCVAGELRPGGSCPRQQGADQARQTEVHRVAGDHKPRAGTEAHGPVHPVQ
ncbi:hypothetical protein KR067_007182, partial [Drosophila pandora]